METAHFIASLKELSFEKLAEATRLNAIRFFNLSLA
jgi:hypothetical protein